MKTLGERIKALRNQMGVNQKEFAEMCGRLDSRAHAWGQSRIGNYETNAREPSLEDIEIMAKALGIAAAELAFSNAQFTRIIKSYKYPLLSTIQAGKFTEVEHFNYVDELDQYELIDSQVKASANAFYLKIAGQSMIPRFNEGDMVLIDPELSPKPGQFVAAINPDGEATFKQYKQLGSIDDYGRPHFKLVPLNDSFPTLNSQEHKIQLIGVAIEHRQMLT
ncbi:MAG: XRE family transcriptional regulator [[Actinobacillus] rossii]|uniref:LexA repressor n=1 Tax=[Actinobacillus] rossii TaxID=123820 RepID=A0A380U0C1_9PAST|nr:XRE family transcriptional regulator [[Actinobacillus] rossii]SUT93719.1 LexA repressor [[Actinobacillus] rossii]